MWFMVYFKCAEVSYFNFGVSKYFCQKFLISVKIWLKKNKSYWRLYTHIFKQIFHYVENFAEKECTGEGGGRESPLPSTCNQYKCVHAVALRLSDFQYLSDLEIRTNFGSHNFSQIQVVNPGSSPTLAKLYFLVKSL